MDESGFEYDEGDDEESEAEADTSSRLRDAYPADPQPGAGGQAVQLQQLMAVLQQAQGQDGSLLDLEA